MLKKLLLLGLISSSAFAEQRLEVELTARPDPEGNITYFALATHAGIPGVPACIRFNFSPPPPYKRIGRDYTIDRTRISAKFIKKYPLRTEHTISVYAQDQCTGARGGDSRYVYIP